MIYNLAFYGTFLCYLIMAVSVPYQPTYARRLTGFIYLSLGLAFIFIMHNNDTDVFYPASLVSAFLSGVLIRFLSPLTDFSNHLFCILCGFSVLQLIGYTSFWLNNAGYTTNEAFNVVVNLHAVFGLILHLAACAAFLWSNLSGARDTRNTEISDVLFGMRSSNKQPSAIRIAVAKR